MEKYHQTQLKELRDFHR